MDLVAIIKAILPVDPSRLKQDAKTLRPGDYLLGRVAKLHGDGKVMMEFNHFKALTEVPIPVKVGQRLTLKVDQVGNPLRLKIVSPGSHPQAETVPNSTAKPASSGLPDLLRQLALDLNTLEKSLSNVNTGESSAAPQTIPGALKNLNTFISGLKMVSDSKALAAELNAKIESSGILFEKKLESIVETLVGRQVDIESAKAGALTRQQIQSDLKPNLLQLLRYVGDLDRDASLYDETVTQRLQRALKTLVDDLGRQKEMAVKRHSTQDPFQFFQLVLPLPQKDEAARLNIYYAKKQKKGPHPNPKVSLLLDLKNLGMVRSDFLMMPNSLSVTIYVADLKLKNYFETQIDSLGKVLEENFEAVSLSVRVSERKIKAFDEPLQMRTEEHQVDLHI